MNIYVITTGSGEIFLMEADTVKEAVEAGYAESPNDMESGYSIVVSTARNFERRGKSYS